MPETKTTKTYQHATGRRKTAVAQARLFAEGTGKITINDKPITADTQVYLEPLKLVGRFGNTDISVIVKGGGTHGQAEAIRHSLARALIELDPEYRTTLKKAGYLTRDPRERERKKFGLKGARRSPQWSKR